MKKLLSSLLFMLVLLFGCNPPIRDVVLPDLTNMTRQQVEEVFEDIPVTIVIKGHPSRNVPEGFFVSYGEDLSAHDIVDSGSVIYIYVTEIETVQLPDLSGMTKDEIIQLMDAEYEFDIDYISVETEIPNNQFIIYGEGFNVGDYVPYNQSLTILISQEIFYLPDLNGFNLTEIQELFSETNLTITYEIVEDDSVNYNEFIAYGRGLSIGNHVDYNASLIIYVNDHKKVELIDLSGMSEEAITNYFNDEGLTVDFIYQSNDSVPDGQFIRYRDHLIGDEVNLDSTVYIILSKQDEYFEPLDLDYDGPRIDPMYSTIDPIDPRGGYYFVTLHSCIDGDTARFYLPDFIPGSRGYESIRFFNMDTEETYPVVEEWGKPASEYACTLLTGAESILIQTDPGDNLRDRHERLLGWIWIVPEGTSLKDGEEDYTIDQYELLNYKVMQQGLAQVKYLYGAGYIKYNGISYTDWMYKAEDYAKEHRLGQWGNLKDPYWDYTRNAPKN